MKLTTIDSEKNYTATVISLPHKQEIKGLDNLVMVSVFGNNCLISRDSDENEKYIFFPAETVLSKEFLRSNNLYRENEMNLDISKKGFFDKSGRVRSVKFKGVTSTGFVIPAMSLSFIGNISLNVGDEFHIIEGVEVCRKYIVEKENIKKTRQEHRNSYIEKFDILIPNQFHFHTDTLHFLKYIENFQLNDYIYITEKYHGTSAIFSNVLVNKKLGIVDRIAKRLGVYVVESEYYQLYSSRNVIKNRYINPLSKEGFYKEDVWKDVSDSLVGKIEKGITIYGEIVGYTRGGEQIQKGYHYGCKKGEWKLYVYRVTSTNPDGFITEFTYSQIKSYCEKYGLNIVNILFYGKMSEFGDSYNEVSERILNKFNIEKMCEMNNNEVPCEGICIRRDGMSTYDTYKIKSKMFLGYETKMLDEGVEIIS